MMFSLRPSQQTSAHLTAPHFVEGPVGHVSTARANVVNDPFETATVFVHSALVCSSTSHHSFTKPARALRVIKQTFAISETVIGT